MDKDLGNKRKVYQKQELLESNIPENPMELFQKWYFEVEESGFIEEVNTMSVTTLELDGFPKSRIVLLKRFTWEGFIFYTNYKSDKGRAIEQNPKISISFFWHQLEQQILIKGIVEKLPENLSDGYFESRPDGSKLGSWASDQSQEVPSRAYLDNRLKEFEKQFEGKEIPRPDFWGGYIVKPISIEFWQGRPNRMHDRILYTLQENFDWKISRLAP